MDIKRLWLYIAVSLIIHCFILSIPIKTGYILGKSRFRFKRKKEKPTIVKLIEIPREKKEKKRVKPPKNPKYLSRYTHRTEKESIPKVLPRPGKPGNQGTKGSLASREKGKEEARKSQEAKSKAPPPERILAERSKKGKYKLPPLDKLLPDPEEMAKRERPERLRNRGSEGSTLDIGEIGNEERKILSLNTMEFKYLSYFLSIKRKIYLLWNYPREAIMAGIEGRLKIKFTIGKDGNLEELKLVQSSGYRILDEEALSAIRDAAPFNPIPKRFGQDHITILATFEYVLVR